MYFFISEPSEVYEASHWSHRYSWGLIKMFYWRISRAVCNVTCSRRILLYPPFVSSLIFFLYFSPLFHSLVLFLFSSLINSFSLCYIHTHTHTRFLLLFFSFFIRISLNLFYFISSLSCSSSLSLCSLSHLFTHFLFRCLFFIRAIK